MLILPYYKEKGFKEGQFPEAEQYYKEAISLPMFPTMTQEQPKSSSVYFKRAISMKVAIIQHVVVANRIRGRILKNSVENQW